RFSGVTAMVPGLIGDVDFMLGVLEKPQRRLHMRLLGGDGRPHEAQHGANSCAGADNLPHSDPPDLNEIHATRNAFRLQDIPLAFKIPGDAAAASFGALAGARIANARSRKDEIRAMLAETSSNRR